MQYIDTDGNILQDISGGRILNLATGVIIIPLSAPTYSYLLKEDGGFLLQENGDKIIL